MVGFIFGLSSSCAMGLRPSLISGLTLCVICPYLTFVTLNLVNPAYDLRSSDAFRLPAADGEPVPSVYEPSRCFIFELNQGYLQVAQSAPSPTYYSQGVAKRSVQHNEGILLCLHLLPGYPVPPTATGDTLS
jgi:hypothetical protein